MKKTEKETIGYELLCGDTVCCTCVDCELNVINQDLAPLYIDDFRKWIVARAISPSRGLTARNLKVVSGLSANAEAFETAMKVNAACVTDNYWVRTIGSDTTYKDVCFDNYDGFFRNLALGLDYTYSNYKSERINPELTNIGGSNKAWVIDAAGNRWLQKKQPLRECYNEILSSKIARALGIETVEYELIFFTEPDPEIGRFGVVRARDFTQEKNVNFESAQFIIKYYGSTDQDVERNAQIFKLWGLEQRYLDIKYLDILIGNPDRHSQNYGVLRDRNTGAVIGMAPNYDNNFAFLAHDMETEAFANAALKHRWKRPALSREVLQNVVEEMRTIEVFGDYANDKIIDIVLKNDGFDYPYHKTLDEEAVDLSLKI